MIEIALSVTIMLLLTIVSVFIRPLSTALVLALGGGTIILLSAGYMKNTQGKLMRYAQLFLAFFFAFSSGSAAGCLALTALLWPGTLFTCISAGIFYICILIFRCAAGYEDLTNGTGAVIASGILKLIILEAVVLLILFIRNLIRKSVLRKKEDAERLRDYSLSEMHQIQKNKELVIKSFYSDKNARLLERENISRNIHNSVGHSITAAIMTLEAADVLFDKDPDEAHKRMNDAGTRIRGSLSAIRSAVRALDEEAGDVTVKDLICYMDNILNEFLMDTERNCERIYDIISEDYLIPTEHAEFLTGALSELLTNGVKHGNATFFIVELSGDRAHVRLSVTDNGKSDYSDENSEQRIREGFGIKKLISYAERCGGSTKFWNEGGFHAVIELPIK